MPTYQYTCRDCGESLEAVQRISDDPLTVCPSCQGSLRKIFNAVGIVFKGPGFYRTDSRDSSNGKAAAPTSDSGGNTDSDRSSAGSSDSTGTSSASSSAGESGPGDSGRASSSAAPSGGSDSTVKAGSSD